MNGLLVSVLLTFGSARDRSVWWLWMRAEGDRVRIRIRIRIRIKFHVQTVRRSYLSIRSIQKKEHIEADSSQHVVRVGSTLVHCGYRELSNLA
jgi:hypothetical protein